MRGAEQDSTVPGSLVKLYILITLPLHLPLLQAKRFYYTRKLFCVDNDSCCLFPKAPPGRMFWRRRGFRAPRFRRQEWTREFYNNIITLPIALLSPFVRPALRREEVAALSCWEWRPSSSCVATVSVDAPKGSGWFKLSSPLRIALAFSALRYFFFFCLAEF